MLANDSVTVAIEVPIWLTERDITALEGEHRVELMPRQGATERVMTGHIDFLQVGNGALRILDYKPNACTNKPIRASSDLRSCTHAAHPGSEIVRREMHLVQRRGVL
jgi:hypothetical protein